MASKPEALVPWLRAQPFGVARIGLEAGPLSHWLFAGLREPGPEGVLVNRTTTLGHFSAGR